MPTSTNQKNVTASGEVVDDEDIETQPTLLSAPAVADRSMLVAPDFRNLDMKALQQPKAQQPKIPGKLPTTWVSAEIPFPSNEYRRSRTVFEVKGSNCSTISDKIFQFNKRRSNYAVYNGSTATCKTSLYMKFTIRLLRKSEDTDTILVDVRRRAGCSMAFRAEHQALTRAIQHGEIISRKDLVTIESFADKPFMQGKFIPLDEVIIERSLKTSVKHLESECYDTRELTVQDLISTTNPTSKETSAKACELIVEKYPQILEHAVNDVAKHVEYGDLNDDDSEEYLRSLTLNLLCNILSADLKNSTLISFIEKIGASITTDLEWYIDQALTCPWNACLAAKCLGKLIPITVIDEMTKSNIRAILQNAKKIGCATYELLEEEAKSTIALIYGRD